MNTRPDENVAAVERIEPHEPVMATFWPWLDPLQGLLAHKKTPTPLVPP